MAITAYFLGVNALAFIMHAEDKLAAGGWLPMFGRIPEILLHQVELVGGSPGSFLAQRMFRHKISKVSYQQNFIHVLLGQTATSLAWGYFQGASWSLAAAVLAPAAMLAVTARLVSKLNDRQRYRDNSGGGRQQQQQWQRPVNAAARSPRRQKAWSKATPREAAQKSSWQ